MFWIETGVSRLNVQRSTATIAWIGTDRGAVVSRDELWCQRSLYILLSDLSAAIWAQTIGLLLSSCLGRFARGPISAECHEFAPIAILPTGSYL
jgi:hypothetical protein